MKEFYEASRRRRVTWLHDVAWAALEQYDLDVDRLRLLATDLYGRFLVETTAGERYVLAISLPGEDERSIVWSEMFWLDALRQDTGLNVPEPVRTRGGDWIAGVDLEGSPQPHLCVIVSWLPGDDLADALEPATIEKLGAFAARLHGYGANFTMPEGFSIPHYDSVFPLRERAVFFDEDYGSLFPPERQRVFQQALERAEEALSGLQGRGEKQVVIHGDLHQWNARINEGEVGVFDFEKLMWAYPVQEIATSLYYLQPRDDYRRLRAAFRRGYSRHESWPEGWPNDVDTFIAARELLLANYVVQDPDPAWRHRAPDWIDRAERRLRTYLERQEVGG